MANRRMFSRTVTGSGRFLRLGAQTRALYFDLGMEADDDGFVEAYARMLSTGSKTRNLKELLEAGFLEMVDERNLVVHITDWEENNVIRKDRYTPSVYRKRQAQQNEEPKEDTQPEPEQPEPSTQPASQPSEAAPQAEANGVTDGCFLGDNRLTQVRLGKDSIGKGRLEQGSSEQLRKGKINLDQNRIGAGAARERELDADKSAPPPNQETEIDFDKKRRDYMQKLLESEYFKCIPKPSGIPSPV